jgi:hypothetical protein
LAASGLLLNQLHPDGWLDFIKFVDRQVWHACCKSILDLRFFGLVALSMILWAGFSRNDWSAAARFLISGAVPVMFPSVIALVQNAN